jgi:hypothetical protein
VDAPSSGASTLATLGVRGFLGLYLSGLDTIMAALFYKQGNHAR